MTPTRRRLRHPALLLPFALLLPACGERSEAAGRRFLDHAGQAIDAAGEAVRESTALVEVVRLLQQVQSELGAIADGPTAQAAKAALQERVAELQVGFDQLGGAKGIADSALQQLGTSRQAVVQALDDRLATLQRDPGVQRVLGPQLEQLRQLLGR